MANMRLWGLEQRGIRHRRDQHVSKTRLAQGGALESGQRLSHRKVRAYMSTATSIAVLVGVSIVAPGFVRAQSFTNVAGPRGAGVVNEKRGGAGWGDLNKDGCPDLVVNTNSNTSAVPGTRVLFQDRSGAACQGTFSDVTNTHAAGMTNRRRDRSVVLADFNQDGDIDVAINNFSDLDIYLNQGSSASPPYSLGVGAGQVPNQNLDQWIGTTVVNSEGLGTADFDGDGDLDLFVESHNYGMRLFSNDGTGNFTEVPPTDTGFPTQGRNGDYAAFTDLDKDGRPDVVARRDGPNFQQSADLWFNEGPPGAGETWFIPSSEIDEASSDDRKGGIVICDFNSDGFLDVLWTPDALYVNGGTNRTFTKQANWASPSVGGTVRGGNCFDADLDGDLDIVLTGTGGTRYYYRNDSTGGTSAFTRIAGAFQGSTQEGFGAAPLDYDRDGDIDLFVNATGASELWLNPISAGDDYLVVVPQVQNPDTSFSIAVGQPYAGRLVTAPRSGRWYRSTAARAWAPAPIQASIWAWVPAAATPHGFSRQPLRTAPSCAGALPSGLGGYQEITVNSTDSDDLGPCAADTDSDGDGTPDDNDPDDDNDGIPDSDELGGIDLSGDDNNNGVPDWQDATVVSCSDVAPDDGTCDTLPTDVDADGDGVPNHLDRDSDGDGITDARENGQEDADGDGIPDGCLPLTASGACANPPAVSWILTQG